MIASILEALVINTGTRELVDNGLTLRQVEVLELLIEHRSTKQIARILKISPSAVDQRIYGAANRLGETDRRQLARKYSAMKRACEQPTGEFSQVHAEPQPPHRLERDVQAKGVFTFRDAISFESFAPWDDEPRTALLEELDSRTGRLVRLAVIVVMAALMAMLLLAAFVIARTLGDLI